MSEQKQVEQTSWKELVGLPWKEAADKIKSQYPGMLVQCVPDGHPVTMDYNENRVRLSVDKDEKVTSTPMIG